MTYTHFFRYSYVLRFYDFSLLALFTFCEPGSWIHRSCGKTSARQQGYQSRESECVGGRCLTVFMKTPAVVTVGGIYDLSEDLCWLRQVGNRTVEPTYWRFGQVRYGAIHLSRALPRLPCDGTLGPCLTIAHADARPTMTVSFRRLHIEPKRFIVRGAADWGLSNHNAEKRPLVVVVVYWFRRPPNLQIAIVRARLAKENSRKARPSWEKQISIMRYPSTPNIDSV